MVKPQQIHLSLIIPTFNEERRIGKSLDRILTFLQSQPYSSEIIIVDDGSRDRTVDVVQQRSNSNPPIRIERQPHNLGKGEAIKRGMLQGNGSYLFFSDADLSVPIEALPTFLSILENDCDVAVGSRRKPGAVLEIHQPLYRELMGKVFTWLSNWILDLRVSDFTCGFKGFRREAAGELFSRQRLGDWSFDAEILYLAKIQGYRLDEIPVVWRNDGATKVRLGRDVASSFLGLFKIRLNHFLGHYK